MKVISPLGIENILEDIVSDRVKQASKLKLPFSGVPSNEVLSEINERIGGEWRLAKPPSLTPEDMKAVADSRFNKKTGTKLTLFLVVILLILAMLTVTVHVIPLYLYYVLCSIFAVGFVLLYSKKQRESRSEFRKGIGQDSLDKEK